MDGTGHPAHDAASTKPDALYKRALQALDGLYPRVAALYQDVAGQYAERQSQAASDPLKNPIQGLSGRLAAAILSGEMSPDDVQKLVRFVVVRSAIWRAYRQADYVGSVDMAAHDQDLRELISQIAHDGEGKLKPFADFQRIFEREIYGLVLTAHPTFLLPRPLIPIFAQLVEFFGGATTMSDQDLADTLKALGGQTHGWTGGVTLDDEHELSIEALHHIQAAVTRFLAGLFAVAAELYPAQWTRLQPRPITLASWVGYDLDGRSDIRWSDTLRARLILQRHQLKNYATRVAAIADAMDQHAADLPATPIKLLASRLDYALRVVSDDLNSLPREADDTAAVEAFGQLLTRDHDIRLTSHDELLNLLHQAIDGLTAPDWDADTILHALVGLRAEIDIYGLGMAHTHVRLNATQIMNAMRGEIDAPLDMDSSSGRRQRARLVNERLDQAREQSINFGSILAERTSAKRLFMLVGQMLKHIDQSAPIRFLIAECEEASTVLAALYFARLFGLADRLDISPLFETDAALQRGDRMIAELLDNQHFCHYVEQRGRLCIQTGFSDAGRYLGQVAASLAIERLRIKIGQLLAKRGLKNVDLLIFDTHGESIGRGSHPHSFKARLDHVFPGANRAYFNDLGLSIKQETSFQGGDGYLFFATDRIAYASLAQLITHGLTAIPGPQLPGHGAVSHGTMPELDQQTDDGFYQDTEYSLDFFIGLADFNDRLVDDPDYAALLGLFGTNMLFPTGSRAVKRQHEKGRPAELASVSQIRAIPHNAVLQQMGYMANSCGGIGSAIGRDVERFWEIFDRSARCQGFMDLANAAHDRSNLDALLAYIDLVDPGFWLQRAMHGDPQAEACERLAQFFQQAGRYGRVWPAAQTLIHDALLLREALNKRAERQDSAAEQSAVAQAWDDMSLPMSHALRLAMIQVLFVLVTRIPRFTSQPDVTMDDVRAQLLSLDVPVALEALQRAFPATKPSDQTHDFGEAATYQAEGQQGYDVEHETLFQPIDQLYQLIREMSSAIAHQIGAVG